MMVPVKYPENHVFAGAQTDQSPKENFQGCDPVVEQLLLLVSPQLNFEVSLLELDFDLNQLVC